MSEQGKYRKWTAQQKLEIVLAGLRGDKVGELAEEAGHHPALLTEWGRTTVT